MGYSKVVYGGKTLIDLTADTVSADKLLEGITAHGRDGEVIVGECTYDSDTKDATAMPNDILTGSTAYVNGVKIEGTMANIGSVEEVITDANDVIAIKPGYHDGSGTVQIDSTEKTKLIAGNIKSGVSILGVEGIYEGEGGKGQTKTTIPYTTAQTILPDEGFDYLTQVNVEPIAYDETPNAQGGLTVTIGTVAPA